MSDQDFQWIPLKDFANIRNVDPNTVRRWIKRNYVEAKRLGPTIKARWLVKVVESPGAVYGYRPPAREGIYFLACGEFIKIGLAADVIVRAETLRTATPYEILPLGWIPVRDADARVLMEQKLHKQFYDYRHRGEWFHDCEAIREFIAEECDEWPTRPRVATAVA